MYFDKHSYWSSHINHLSQKLINENAILCRLCQYVNTSSIKLIKYPLIISFIYMYSHQLYVNHLLNLIQKKSFVNFTLFDARTIQTFTKLNIIKLPYFIYFR